MKAGLILARIDSTRFPNKAITNLGKKKLIQWCIDGVRNINNLTPIVVTTDRAIDLPLVALAEENKIQCFRGNFLNISKRVNDCINYYNLDSFARINGDSPFINKLLLEKTIKILDTQPNVDIVTNLLPRAFPYGLSVEFIRSKVFRENFKYFSNRKYKEHFTTWFYENQTKVKIFKLKYDFGNDHDIKLAVDTFDDHSNIENVIIKNPGFDFYNSDVQDLVTLFRKERN